MLASAVLTLKKSNLTFAVFNLSSFLRKTRTDTCQHSALVFLTPDPSPLPHPPHANQRPAQPDRNNRKPSCTSFVVPRFRVQARGYGIGDVRPAPGDRRFPAWLS